MDQRGGHTLKTGKIGRVNCIRQQMLMPGETLNISLNGQVKLESLRERDSLRINAHLAVFQTPIRWLWSEWPDYIKEGPDTSRTVPLASQDDLGRYGIGGSGTALSFPKWFEDAYLRVYNEWYKWPEDADNTSVGADGNKAVPLQHAWNRCRYNVDPNDAGDYNVGSATEFDVRSLAYTQARFKAAMERDVLSYNRYMELINEMYGADGDREVDQVPRMVDQIDLTVGPREIPATDGASLGQWQSLFDFGVDHQIRGVTCPEHCILTYMLVVRFAPIIEGRNPLASARYTWEDIVGDPTILQSKSPSAVQIRDIAANESTTELGYLPAGWQWRSGFDVIGDRVDTRQSFPYMNSPSTQTGAKDATNIKDAFRSDALGDYVVDVSISEESRNPISSALESYFAGMDGHGSNAEIPKQGKML